MEVLTVESETFKRFENMFLTALEKVETLATENKLLKSEPLMTVEDVAAYTTLSADTVKKYKDKIGCSQPGGKNLLFRKQDVDIFINSTYRKAV